MQGKLQAEPRCQQEPSSSRPPTLLRAGWMCPHQWERRQKLRSAPLLRSEQEASAWSRAPRAGPHTQHWEAR